MTVTAFLAVCLLHLMAAISPGPAVLMAARTGLSEGLRTGAYLAAGIGAGAVVWASAALFGLNIVFQAAPTLLWGMKIAGGAYLLWMGWKMIRHASDPMDLNSEGKPPRAPLQAFRLGLVTQLVNPKPAILFSAMFVGTVPAGTPVWVYAALLTVIFLNECLWNIAVARVFSLERTRRGYISLKTLIDRVFGGMLALLGLKIATT